MLDGHAIPVRVYPTLLNMIVGRYHDFVGPFARPKRLRLNDYSGVLN